MALESGRYCLFVDVSGKLLRCDGDGLEHVLRHVVTLVVIGIEIGVLLRKYEGLVSASVLVEIGDVETGVSAIIATAGEEYPAAVA